MFYKYHCKNGFTLIELLIVIAVITILTAVIIPNFRKGEESTRLIRAAQQVIQDIRKAQNMALSSKEFPDRCLPEKICDYYGVYLDEALPSSYKIFVSDNADYNPGEEIETRQLEENIIIEDISSGNKTDITFAPPYASVNFVPPVPPTSKVIITLKIEGGICPDDCIYIGIDNNGWISAGD